MLVHKRKEVAWPSWSGTPETFGFYLARLKAKIEEDLNMLGPNRAICLSMIETLPETKQYLVGHWFERGGDDGKFRWEDLLDHFRDQFEDRELKMAAGQALTKMRQGSQQYFRDFLRDFEYKLSQCGGNNIGSVGKLIHLNACINETLQRALVYVKLPPFDNYSAWVTEVGEVAGKLEALPNYRPKGAKYTKTWYTSDTPISTLQFSASESSNRDSDGDTIMGGTNTMLASIQTKLNQVEARQAKFEQQLSRPTANTTGNTSTKPRAPWRPKAEYIKLLQEGRCTRCTKNGHLSPDCPSFRLTTALSRELM